MGRRAMLCCVVALTGSLGGCVASEQAGDGVALMREVMIESAKSTERHPSESSERAIDAVRDWRRGQGEGSEAG